MKNIKHMNSNEFRIGNLVYDLGYSYDDEGNFTFDNSSEIIEVTSETLMDLETDCVFLKPIPINNIWLRKFNFIELTNLDETNNSFYFWESSVFSIEKIRNSYWQVYYMSNERIVKLKYIHQLQNLYFTLTQEELHTKLNSKI